MLNYMAARWSINFISSRIRQRHDDVTSHHHGNTLTLVDVVWCRSWDGEICYCSCLTILFYITQCSQVTGPQGWQISIVFCFRYNKNLGITGLIPYTIFIFWGSNPKCQNNDSIWPYWNMARSLLLPPLPPPFCVFWWNDFFKNTQFIFSHPCWE